MEKITSLLKKLKSKAASEAHLHHLTFKEGEMFGWNHTACAISYNPSAKDAQMYLLHEFGHALLGHTSYSRDIVLLKMERDAWEAARELGSEYGVHMSDEIIEGSLDTYRDWLHSRSLCPRCSATGIQSKSQQYSCPACRTTWEVNEARTCALRRYTKKRSV